jgi:hypothetical protein
VQLIDADYGTVTQRGIVLRWFGQSEGEWEMSCAALHFLTTTDTTAASRALDLKVDSRARILCDSAVAQSRKQEETDKVKRHTTFPTSHPKTRAYR